jgi:hypothetical protein
MDSFPSGYQTEFFNAFFMLSVCLAYHFVAGVTIVDLGFNKISVLTEHVVQNLQILRVIYA